MVNLEHQNLSTNLWTCNRHTTASAGRRINLLQPLTETLKSKYRKDFQKYKLQYI